MGKSGSTPVVQVRQFGSKIDAKGGIKATRSILVSMLLVGSMALLFVFGRVYWDERYYVPEEGLGYSIGLTGGILMLLAYAYAFVKHNPTLRQKGFIVRSLSWHITFGLVGVYLIVIHSTFHIGSVNGGVALVSTILVFISGVVGRYLYTRIHYGIGSRHLAATRIEEELTAFERSTSMEVATQEIRDRYLHRRYSLFSAIASYLFFPFRQRRVLREFKEDADDVSLSLLSMYLKTMRGLVYLRIYESFFRMWRYAHVPLLILLFASGSIHVFAVHVY